MAEETRSVPMSLEEIDQLSATERSIQHWSVELAMLDYQTQQVRLTIGKLVEAKGALIGAALAREGVDPSTVVETTLEPVTGLIVKVTS